MPHCPYSWMNSCLAVSSSPSLLRENVEKGCTCGCVCSCNSTKKFLCHISTLNLPLFTQQHYNEVCLFSSQTVDYVDDDVHVVLTTNYIQETGQVSTYLSYIVISCHNMNIFTRRSQIRRSQTPGPTFVGIKMFSSMLVNCV